MRTTIAVILLVAVMAALVWPGFFWGHPIWGPWITKTPAPAAPGDPLTPSLTALGFSSREEIISFFDMEGVEPREIATCPGEVNCVRILREKDANGFIKPFKMTNPTTVTFDGWRAAGQTGGQAKVPPGTWWVEGVTIRPWR